jgi:hypothetical protein
MSQPYIFETRRVAIAADGLHLLGGGYNYATIPFNTVLEIQVRKGKHLKLWWLVLLIAVAFIPFFMMDQLGLILTYANRESINYLHLLTPLFPLFLCIYGICIALRNTQVMIVRTTGKNYYCSLRYLVKENQLSAFVDHLQQVFPALDNQLR